MDVAGYKPDSPKKKVSQIFYEAARKTWGNRQGKLGEVVELFKDFSGLRAVKVGGLPEDTYCNLGFDGIGTKIELAERACRHDTVAYDLFAMVCDDAVVRGAEPVVIGSVIDFKSLGADNSYIHYIQEMADGYVNAAKEANVAVLNGEIAELGYRVHGFGSFNYNWCAAVLWFARKGRMLTGKEIKAGNKIVALKEDSFRSNGLTLVRTILGTVYGYNWHNEHFNGKKLAELVLKPSRIYCKAVVDMFGSLNSEPKTEVHGVSHITGGGIPEKLGRTLLPSGFGACLDDLFEPTELMLYCQEKGNVSDAKAYSAWNMGQGMLIITPKPDEVIRIAKEHNIESKVAGEIVSKPGIVVKSKGFGREELVFETRNI